MTAQLPALLESLIDLRELFARELRALQLHARGVARHGGLARLGRGSKRAASISARATRVASSEPAERSERRASASRDDAKRVSSGLHSQRVEVSIRACSTAAAVAWISARAKRASSSVDAASERWRSAVAFTASASRSTLSFAAESGERTSDDRVHLALRHRASSSVGHALTASSLDVIWRRRTPPASAPSSVEASVELLAACTAAAKPGSGPCLGKSGADSSRSSMSVGRRRRSCVPRALRSRRTPNPAAARVHARKLKFPRARVDSLRSNSRGSRSPEHLLLRFPRGHGRRWASIARGRPRGMGVREESRSSGARRAAADVAADLQRTGVQVVAGAARLIRQPLCVAVRSAAAASFADATAAADLIRSSRAPCSSAPRSMPALRLMKQSPVPLDRACRADAPRAGRWSFRRFQPRRAGGSRSSSEPSPARDTTRVPVLAARATGWILAGDRRPERAPAVLRHRAERVPPRWAGWMERRPPTAGRAAVVPKTRVRGGIRTSSRCAGVPIGGGSSATGLLADAYRTALGLLVRDARSRRC